MSHNTHVARLTFKNTRKGHEKALNITNPAREKVGLIDLMMGVIFEVFLGGGRRRCRGGGRPKGWRLGFGDEDGIDEDEMGERVK